MLSLAELVQKEFKRVEASQESLQNMYGFFANTTEKSQKSVIAQDLQRTAFHSSVNKKAYSQKLLAQPSREYFQGKHDGSITTLITSSALIDKIELPITGYYSFAYLNQNGKMSTFSLNIDFFNQFWYVAVCDDPFRELPSFDFKYLDKTMPITLESINAVVLQPEITQIVYDFIQQELNHLPKFTNSESYQEQKIKLIKNFGSKFDMKNITHGEILSYTHQQINQELWETQVELLPSKLNRKQRRAEILRDYERTLIHPSIKSPRDIYQLWEKAQIPYFQGMLAGTPLIVKKDRLDPPYEFRINFIYQDEDGKYSTLAFYLDLVNKKCFLACNHDPLQEHDKQTSLTLFPLGDYATDELSFVIKHPEIELQMKELLATVPKMLSIAASFDPDDRMEELPRIIHKLEDIFKYRFSLKASINHEPGSGFFQYQDIDEPKDSLESLLRPVNNKPLNNLESSVPQEQGVLYTIFATPVMFLIGLLMAIFHRIFNSFNREAEDTQDLHQSFRV